MTVFVGIVLWLFFALTALSCRRVARQSDDPTATADNPSLSRRRRATLRAAGCTALAIALAGLLLRPDEEITIGEDAGGYFNAALAYARHGSLDFPDPALSIIAPHERILFRYGHEGFLLTKDATLWAQDPNMDSVGAFFFPGFSLLLSVPAAFGFPYAAFWAPPLLAVMTAWLIARFAIWIGGGSRRAGWIAFALYVLNPAIVWNARCLRAEWPASFLALAGLLPWIARVAMDKRVAPIHAFCAGLASALAVSFHITALYVAAPLAMLSFVATRRGAFWAAWWGGLLLGAALFLAQIVWVTDPYWMSTFWTDPVRRSLLLGGAVVALIGLVVVRAAIHSRALASRLRSETLARVAGGLVVAAFLAIAVFSMLFRTEHGRIPGLPAWTASYLALTDFDGVRRLFSRAGLAVALVGLVFLGVRHGVGVRVGRWLLCVLAPASLTIGWVVNYMFETRRMVAFLVPLLALGATAALMAAGDAAQRCARILARWRGAAAARHAGGVTSVLLAVGFLALGARGRLHLYTVWNNRDAFGFFREAAAIAAREGDFLFGEYTQKTSPIERLSGLPLLSVGWDWRSEDEYRKAELAIERLVHARPERRHLLVTPFAGAGLPGVYLKPLAERIGFTTRLARRRDAVPDAVRRDVLRLRLFRVAPERAEETAPYVRVMDGSRFGFSGAANFMPNRSIDLSAARMTPDMPLRIELPPDLLAEAIAVVFPFYVPSRATTTSDAAIARIEWEDAASIPAPERFSPAPGWEFLRSPLPRSLALPAACLVSVSAEALLTDILFMGRDGRIVGRVGERLARQSVTIPPVDSQWTRSETALALPDYAKAATVWMHVTNGRDEPVGTTLTLLPREGDADDEPRVSARLERGWHWIALPIRPGTSPREGFQWRRFLVSPAWDPGISSFPSDLGVRIQALAVFPES